MSPDTNRLYDPGCEPLPIGGISDELEPNDAPSILPVQLPRRSRAIYEELKHLHIECGATEWEARREITSALAHIAALIRIAREADE